MDLLMPIGPTRIFVYGTLKPGYEPYRRFCAGRTLAEPAAMAAGRIYHLPLLGYPAMVGDAFDAAFDVGADLSWDLSQDTVHGHLLSFRERSVLAQLDDYEQHDPAVIAQHYPGCDPEAIAYQRQEIWVYGVDQVPMDRSRRVLAGEPAVIGRAWAYLMNPESIQLLQGQPVASGNWSL
jgi:gamma-glutamylcyclotransferase (GGCT)/AIG2-like uncharacterized protein YtfP